MLQHQQFSNAFWTKAINTMDYVLKQASTMAVERITPKKYSML